jgi:outer membrane protein
MTCPSIWSRLGNWRGLSQVNPASPKLRLSRDQGKRCLAAWLCGVYFVSVLHAQDSSIDPVPPQKRAILRPYFAPDAPPARLNNSSRLGDLIRAGTLYLTAQDAIALALEDNIDLESARYNPLIAAWNLERSQAGGALPGVPNAAGQAGSVASGQGVAGSQAAAGVGAGGAGGAGGSGGNATISQIGPIAQTFDPSIQESQVFSHTTTPEPNATQSITSVLVDATHVYNASLQEGFITGGSVTLSYSDHYLKENAATDIFNPTSAPSLGISLQQSLLRGFGIGVNQRTINVNKINLQTSDLSFKSQVIGTVASVLIQYYGLAADYEDLRAKQGALDTAQRFFENTRRQEELGALSQLDVTTAQSQVASSQNDVVVSETALRQDELQLKNVLSRTGAMDPALATARIVTLDRIDVPDTDNLPPLEDLVQQALANRADLALQKANITTAEISALGTKNGVLPSLTAFGGETQAGLAGKAPGNPNLPLVGGFGTALAQVLARHYPTERIGVFFQAPLNNRQAEADYGIDQLQLRQTQLSAQKSINQVVVDVSNNVIALRQARARHDAAAKNRELQQKLLDAEQRKFLLGASTPYNITQQQRDLATAAATEVSALASYVAARMSLDQTLGITLEANHVSIDEARTGKVARASTLPATP